MAILKRLPAEDYIPRTGLKYVDCFGLQEMYKKLAFRSNLILLGPKGIGKSLSYLAYAFAKKIPVVTLDCSEDMNRYQIVGTLTIQGDTTPFVLGPLTAALEVANEVGECLLGIEEINALQPSHQKLLNPFLDFRRKLEVPEAEKVFRLKDGARLWVVGTMNDTSYGGVYSLNEDLKSRLRIVPLDYPDEKYEWEIVSTVVEKIDKGLVGKVLRLAQETRQPNAFEYALSPRDVIQILKDSELVGLEKALWLSTGKFEGTDRDAYHRRLDSIFPFNFSKGKNQRKTK